MRVVVPPFMVLRVQLGMRDAPKIITKVMVSDPAWGDLGNAPQRAGEPEDKGARGGRERKGDPACRVQAEQTAAEVRR